MPPLNAALISYAPKLEDWLQNILGIYHGTSGTIHLFENGGLRLATAINIPPQVQEAVAWVPNGKGMAGLALQRKEPIHTCNLQEDRSGNVKPGAKAVDAQAAVAVPVLDLQGDVRAVIGIAFQEEREFTDAELEDLLAAAATLPEDL
ncbi:MAG: GAF domain-containing protein [Acidobacteriota bacterium]|nr:GAF domain-containing protein [Acidobacteriota bacterium]